MTTPQELMEKIQNKSYAVRVRILWTSVIVIGCALIVLWVYGLKNRFNGLNGQSLITPNSETSKTLPETNLNLTAVESIQRNNQALKIYFNINNQTDNILNFSQLTDIRLDVGDKTYTPKQIVNRQSEPFVKKILSHTQSFGILLFDPVAENDAALTFSGLSFDKTPNDLFQQELKLNLESLSKLTPIRN